MALSAHLSELSEKHKMLERSLEDAQSHPSIDDTLITKLKRKKLRLKDEIERLRKQQNAS